MLEFLPENVQNGLKHINVNDVYEIRLRAEKPTTVNYKGQYRYLGFYGVVDRKENAIVCDMEDISDCVFKAGKYSVYAVEEEIKRGFITGAHGERIGLAGEYVFDKGQPLTLRSITSLCIRVPHEIKGCGEEIYQCCMSDRVRNVLICSSPGVGKTTILRDLGRILCERTQKNVLICDERGEICAGEVGASCDVLKFCDKQTAFEIGIRTMRPDVIITDELSLMDCQAIEKAISAGIYVLASAHFSCMESIKKPFHDLFDLFVILDENCIGKIKKIYQKKEWLETS